MAFNLSKGVSLGEPKPKIDEFNWGAKEPSVQIQFSGSGTGYQAMPFSVDVGGKIKCNHRKIK
ncbi:hypothetical protein ACLJ9L_000073 [Campylobacter jejuni]